MLKTFIMLFLICLLALIIEMDFFIALCKFGAEYFGAPDDLKELVKKIPPKPFAVTIAGIIVLLLAFAGVAGVFLWAVVDTYRNYPGMLQVFLRFAILLDGYKLFDIVCFDWLLLTKIRFPEKLYPETRGAKGYDSFGFNAKSQITKLILFPVIALVVAVIFAYLCG